PGWTGTDETGKPIGRCMSGNIPPESVPRFCGILQGYLGYSTVFRAPVAAIIAERLSLTGWLMLWVMVVMVPAALLVGVLAGARAGSRHDGGRAAFSLGPTARGEFLSGVVFIAVFARVGVGLQSFKACAPSAMEEMAFRNFPLPVLPMAFFGLGYSARMA